MQYLVIGVLSTLLAVYLLWHFRARGGKEHPNLRGWFGHILPITLVIMLMFGISMAVAGIVR